MPFKSKPIPDIIGNRYGHLLVLEYVDKTDYREHRWKCKCDCGNICIVNGRTLFSEREHSCGCVTKKYLTAGDSKRCTKAGKARAEKRNKDGVNVDMLFREKTISTNTSGVQGVSWSKTARKWHVYVGLKNKRYTIGYFEDFTEAKTLRETALVHVKQGTFEDFYEKVTGKRFD